MSITKKHEHDRDAAKTAKRSDRSKSASEAAAKKRLENRLAADAKTTALKRPSTDVAITTTTPKIVEKIVSEEVCGTAADLMRSVVRSLKDFHKKTKHQDGASDVFYISFKFDCSAKDARCLIAWAVKGEIGQSEAPRRGDRI